MKSPPVQHNDDAAHELVEAFIRGDIERGPARSPRTAHDAGPSPSPWR